MSDTKSWNDSFAYLKDKTVNPVRACATYEQIEAQNRKNNQRYGGSPGLWTKDRGIDIEVKPVSTQLEELYIKDRGNNL